MLTEEIKPNSLLTLRPISIAMGLKLVNYQFNLIFFFKLQ